jgi:hypothetical protein
MEGKALRQRRQVRSPHSAVMPPQNSTPPSSPRDPPYVCNREPAAAPQPRPLALAVRCDAIQARQARALVALCRQQLRLWRKGGGGIGGDGVGLAAAPPDVLDGRDTEWGGASRWQGGIRCQQLRLTCREGPVAVAALGGARASL